MSDDEDGCTSEGGDAHPADDDEQLAFHCEDRIIVENVEKAIRKLLSRPELTPEEISQIGVFLFGVSRLPKATAGIAMRLTLKYEFGGELSWVEFSLEEDRFSITRGAYIITPGVGGDTQSAKIFDATTDYRDANTFEAFEFSQALATLVEDPSYQTDVEDDSEEPFSHWDLEADPDTWSDLNSDFA